MCNLQNVSPAGREANEEPSSLHECPSSKPAASAGEEVGWGEERGETCKKEGGGIVMGEEGGEYIRELGRRASVRKLSLSRRQSRDLLKKKISFEEQVLLVLAQVQVQVLLVIPQDLVQV